MLVLILVFRDTTLPDEFEKWLNQSTWIYKEFEICLKVFIWIPQNRSLACWASKEQNSLACWQNPLAPAYWTNFLCMQIPLLFLKGCLFYLLPSVQWKNMYTNSSKQQWAINDSFLGKQLILIHVAQGQTIRKLIGGGVKYQKKCSWKGNLKKKKLFIPNNP